MSLTPLQRQICQTLSQRVFGSGRPGEQVATAGRKALRRAWGGQSFHPEDAFSFSFLVFVSFHVCVCVCGMFVSHDPNPLLLLLP